MNYLSIYYYLLFSRSIICDLITCLLVNDNKWIWLCGVIKNLYYDLVLFVLYLHIIYRTPVRSFFISFPPMSLVVGIISNYYYSMPDMQYTVVSVMMLPNLMLSVIYVSPLFVCFLLFPLIINSSSGRCCDKFRPMFVFITSIFVQVLIDTGSF